MSRDVVAGSLSSAVRICSIQTSSDAIFVGGVWGPYYSAMLPGKFLSEGGQSATGSVVSHVVAFTVITEVWVWYEARM